MVWFGNRQTDTGPGRSIENWEEGLSVSNSGWGGDAGGFDNQSDATLQGTNNIVNTASSRAISTSADETSQGNEYRVRVYWPSGVGDFFFFGIHDANDNGGTSPQSGYYAHLSQPNNQINLHDVNSTNIASSASVTINQDTEYRVGLEHASNGDVTAFVYDSTGSQIASTGTANDESWTEGAAYLYHHASGLLSDDVREI